MLKIFFKKILYLFLFTLCFNTSNALAVNTHKITDYHQTFFPCYKDGHLRIALRMYYLDTVPYYLVVDPMTFATETAPAIKFKSRKTVSAVPGYFTMQELSATPYMRALLKYTSPPYVLENYGITRAEKPVKGMFITADMCPSVKPFEKDFFHTLVAIAKQNSQPTPVALSITGLWMISHPAEFNWLIKQAEENKLNITWINHSFSHAYYADLPYEKNFLLEPHTNVTHEILATEKLLLEHGQLPSVFFRFPGLVSNEKLVLKLRKYGLIPVGADAWLAKDQQPTAGSFILVHGNSNEPDGIIKLMPMLRDPNYYWLSLAEAFLNDKNK